MDALRRVSRKSISDPMELSSVEGRIARRRQTLPSLELPDGSGGIPVSKNSSFVEENVLANQQVWNGRFTGAFTAPLTGGLSNENDAVAPEDPKANRPPTPEVTCCSLFFA